jgi:hypothetical protein
MSNYENLKVWHRAVELAVSTYKLTQSNKAVLRRASITISSRIPTDYPSSL